MSSRVHELGRMGRLDLIGLLLSLLERAGGSAVVAAVPDWSNEKIISMIIDLEGRPY